MFHNNGQIKQLLFLVSAMFFLGFTSVAQHSDGEMPVAVPLTRGAWIYLGKEIPQTGHYVIERRNENASKFKKIGESALPKSESQMRELQNDYMKFLGELDPLSDNYIQALWSYIQENSTLHQMRETANLPMMYLLAGNAFMDKTAEPNTNYVYKISFIGGDGRVISETETNPTTELNQRVFPEIIAHDKKLLNDKLILSWSVVDDIDFVKFNVYRTVFGRDDYVKMISENITLGYYSENDTLRLIAVDSLGTTPAWYEYVVAPIDAFGNEGEKQGYLSGGNIDEFYAPPITNFNAVSKTNDYEVELTWSFEKTEYLNGISVMRSTNFDSAFVKIATLPIEDTAFTDVLPVAGENYYYYLMLESAETSPVSSAKVFVAYTGMDEDPVAPQPVEAVTAENGIQIHWENENTFAKGFYVYRRSLPDEPFVQISPLIPFGEETYSYLDTTGLLLGNEVYDYVVRTVSENGRLSENSETATATPGIKTAITAPMNLRSRLEGNMVTVVWDDMTPWIKDLLGYSIFRKTENGEWELLTEDKLYITENYFAFTDLKSGTYIYAVRAFDYFGNESPMSESLDVVIEEELLPAPSGITALVSGESVLIRWGQISGNDLKVNIYRSEKEQDEPLLLATVNMDEREFEDKTSQSGKLYFYSLSAVTSTGKEGRMSEKVSVRVGW